MWLKRQEGAPWLKHIENPDIYYKTQFDNSEQLLNRSTERHAKLGGQDSVQYYDRIEAERQAERQPQLQLHHRDGGEFDYNLEMSVSKRLRSWSPELNTI